MGLTYVQATVSGPKGRSRRLKFLVDSGAHYTVLPRAVWQALGLKPQQKMAFVLADGTEIDRSVSECRIRLEGRTAHTPVILGERRDDALLGVITLEIFGLVLNPFERTLHHMRLRLA